ncbi:hypothetical protein, partial [Paracoccus sp. SCN 68-21]|uniref:hypothetical protein n=1 Tax=Paracoccus sp. SCN 68-21 TaxID=1660154 RepID=UPI00257F337B
FLDNGSICQPKTLYFLDYLIRSIIWLSGHREAPRSAFLAPYGGWQWLEKAIGFTLGMASLSCIGSARGF